MTRGASPQRRRRRGYILVVTLGLLVLSATLLVSIGRAAVDHALRARRAQAELQQRWAVISARSAILPHADDSLARLEQDLHRPLPVFRTSIRLGDQSFDLILSDEQAKANVNAILFSSGKSSTESRIRTALSGSGLTNTIQLRPAALEPARSDARADTIHGFGQVFDSVGPERLVREGDLSPVETLTCWGDGSINVMRASRNSLRLFAAQVMNDLTIGRLIKARDAAFAPIEQARLNLAPRASDPAPAPRSADAVTSLLARAGVDAKFRGQVAFTSRSTCHSLWIIPRQSGPARCWLFVADESTPAYREILAFTW